MAALPLDRVVLVDQGFPGAARSGSDRASLRLIGAAAGEVDGAAVDSQVGGVAAGADLDGSLVDQVAGEIGGLARGRPSRSSRG